MFNIQNLPQVSSFNNLISKSQNKFATPVNNKLERSPMCDTVDFTGKKDDEIYTPAELNDDDIIYNLEEVNDTNPDEDIIVLLDDEDLAVIEPEIVEIEPKEDDYYRYALQQEEDMRAERLREEEEEERKRQFEDEMFMNDMIVYGVILPEMIAEQQMFAQDNNPVDIEPDNFMGNDDSSYMGGFEDQDPYGFDGGFDDYGF